MGWGAEVAEGLVDAFREGWVDHPLQLAVGLAGPEGSATAGDTPLLFEIGSVTKTMTALLIALAVVDGSAGLDSPIGRWLDAGTNADITVEQLLTHTSGLPRLAPNHSAAREDPMDPYAHYTEELALEGLRLAERTDIGTHAYSNFGFQLLGIVIERIMGRSYAECIQAEVFDTFGMAMARITGDDGPQAVGYLRGEPVPHWHGPLPAPGLVEATAADMAAYVAGLLDPPSARLGEASALLTGDPVRTWDRTPAGVLHHGGATYGFNALVAIDPAAGRSIATLVADGGLQDLRGAALRVLGGTDPADLRPSPVDATWSDRALALLPAVVERRWVDLREAMDDGMRERLTVERLDVGWHQTFGTGGEYRGGERVRRAHQIGSVVIVDLECDWEHGLGTARMSFSPADGLLAGLLIS